MRQLDAARWRLGAVLLTATLVLVVAPGWAQRFPSPADRTPIADVLELVVLDRELLAIDGDGGGQTTERLRIGETVLWKGSRGIVGVALTDARILAVAVSSAAFQETEFRRTETRPSEALLGDRIALVTTSERVLGFNGSSANLVEIGLGPRELVVATDVGENAAVVVTDRRVLGLSPAAGGFFERPLGIREQIASVNARANLATVTTDRRILIFRSNTGGWEERRLDAR
jgi:hypothetical protein